jgi:hypothetical protein
MKVCDRHAVPIDGGDVHGDDLDPRTECRRGRFLRLGRRLSRCLSRRLSGEGRHDDENRGQRDRKRLHGSTISCRSPRILPRCPDGERCISGRGKRLARQSVSRKPELRRLRPRGPVTSACYDHLPDMDTSPKQTFPHDGNARSAMPRLDSVGPRLRVLPPRATPDRAVRSPAPALYINRELELARLQPACWPSHRRAHPCSSVKFLAVSARTSMSSS